MLRLVFTMAFYSMFFVAQIFADVSSGIINTPFSYSDYTGVTKIYYYDDSKNALINPFDKDKMPSRYLDENDSYEIRLQNIQFNQAFELFSSSKSQNEYAVFLTIGERNMADNNLKVMADRRLIYSADYGRQKNIPLNLSNKLIFRDKYHGGDIYFKLEVVEMDSDKLEKYRQLFEPLLNAVKTVSSVASAVNSQYTQLLDAMGKALYQQLKKDDLILTYETEFLRHGTVENNGSVGQNYFSWGEYYLVRDSQSRGEVIEPMLDTKSLKVYFKNEEDKNETLSFAHISILKRKTNK